MTIHEHITDGRRCDGPQGCLPRRLSGSGARSSVRFVPQRPLLLECTSLGGLKGALKRGFKVDLFLKGAINVGT